jgi:hypothetical protein
MFLAQDLYSWRKPIPATPLTRSNSIICTSNTHNTLTTVLGGDILIYAGAQVISYSQDHSRNSRDRSIGYTPSFISLKSSLPVIMSTYSIQNAMTHPIVQSPDLSGLGSTGAISSNWKMRKQRFAVRISVSLGYMEVLTLRATLNGPFNIPEAKTFVIY